MLDVNSKYSPELGKIPGATNEAPAAEATIEDNATLAEDLSRQTGDTRVYAYYAKAVGWSLSLAFLLSNAVVIFGMKFPDIWLKWWSEDEKAHPGQHTWFYIGVNLGLAVCSLLSVVVMLLVLFILAVPQASARIHKRLLDTAMKAPYSFFASTAADGALTCVAELILIAIVSQYMAILAPFLIVLLYFLQKYYLHTSRQMRLLDLEAKSPLYSNFLEAQSGVVTIRAFRWQKAWKDRNIKLLDDSQRPFYLLYCIQRWLNLVLDLVVAAFAVVVMTLATQLDHGVSGGSLGVAFINILSFGSSLAYLITAWTQLETSIGAIARVRGFEAATPSEARDKDVQDPPHTWPDNGAIEFCDLSAGYK
ncbi:hypothetical protein N0V94_005841 [Neodidymelliopsis sp. IMI 364377]|nr:hypothetical protein N0V94_005841 [Neodidymelliopsis sp. IMI 364377]